MYWPKKEIVKLHLIMSCCVLCFGFHIALKFGLQSFLEVIAFNGRIILKCILKKIVWNMWLHFFGSDWGPVMDCSKDTD